MNAGGNIVGRIIDAVKTSENNIIGVVKQSEGYEKDSLHIEGINTSLKQIAKSLGELSAKMIELSLETENRISKLEKINTSLLDKLIGIESFLISNTEKPCTANLVHNESDTVDFKSQNKEQIPSPHDSDSSSVPSLTTVRPNPQKAWHPSQILCGANKLK